MATVQKTVAKKKRWAQILAPKAFGGEPIGETYISELDTQKGKSITLSQASLTGDPHKQNVLVSFVITGNVGDKLMTEITQYKLASASLRRYVKRVRDKADDSFTVLTADGKRLRIKPLMVTRFRATAPILTTLRKAARAFMTSYTLKTPYETMIKDLLGHKLQHDMLDALKKISPLSACELRWMKVIGQEEPPKQPAATDVAEEKKEEEIEEGKESAETENVGGESIIEEEPNEQAETPAPEESSEQAGEIAEEAEA